MIDLSEHAAAEITRSGRVALPLADLARRLGTHDIHGLAERLDADDRFLVLRDRTLSLSLPDPTRSLAYRTALDRAGLHGSLAVALAPEPTDPEPRTARQADASAVFRPLSLLLPRPARPVAADVTTLLRQTTAHLLTDGPAGRATAAAAERACRAVSAAAAVSAATSADAGAPSTTRPPRPRPPGTSRRNVPRPSAPPPRRS